MRLGSLIRWQHNPVPDLRVCSSGPFRQLVTKSWCLLRGLTVTSFLWLWAVSLCAWRMGQLLTVGLCDMHAGRCILCHGGSVTVIPLALSAFLSRGRYLGPILLPCKGRHLALCNIFYNGMTISRFWVCSRYCRQSSCHACHWISEVET